MAFPPILRVMAGLVRAIHVLLARASQKDVDARDERGHDGRRGDSIHHNVVL
jgi:hypothetical protein